MLVRWLSVSLPCAAADDPLLGGSHLASLHPGRRAQHAPARGSLPPRPRAAAQQDRTTGAGPGRTVLEAREGSHMNSECTVCIGLLSSEPGVGVTTWRADHTRFECTWFIAKSYHMLEGYIMADHRQLSQRMTT